MSGAAELGQLGSVLTVDSTTGNVGIGASPSYAFDVIKSGAVQARFGSTAGATTGGAAILSTGASQALFGGGWDYNGTSFVARSTSASMLICGSGLLQLATNSGLTAGNTFTQTPYMQLDTSGNFLQIGSGGIGYGTGSGGSVTQLTSKGTGVTLNKTNGKITMHNAALAASTTVGFVFTNSTIVATDAVLVHPSGGNSGLGTYIVWADNLAAGSCVIWVRNVSAASQSEALTLNFAVIKAVTA